jgi:hypothetical protein
MLPQTQSAPGVPAATSSATTATSAPRLPTSEASLRWYGWQIAVADAVPVALVLSVVHGKTAASPLTAYVFGAVWFSAFTPLLHIVHEQPWRALPSIVARSLVAFGGPAILNLGGCDDCTAPRIDPKWALAAALLSVSALDALTLGGKREAPPRQTTLWLAPTGRGFALGGTW